MSLQNQKGSVTKKKICFKKKKKKKALEAVC